MKKITIGGQAVMEGVMMRNKNAYAVAVRRPDHEIEVKKGTSESIADRHAICQLPIIRGVVSFVESLTVGMKTLSYSSSFYEEEEEPGKTEQFLNRIFGDKTDSVLMGVTMVLSVILAVGIFMALPFVLSNLLRKVISSYTVRTLIEGVIRVAIFLIYILLISRMEDIRRVFMYHGAEHKTINCLEHGEDLTPENVKKYSRFHKRCGTSFMLIVMIVSIVVFLFIRVDNFGLRLLLRLLLVPVVAGISFEFIRLAGKSNSRLVCMLSRPGMALQYFTTKEPDEDMIEVAIASVEGVMDWKSYLEAMRNGELED
ncbi:MAG: DUF1385 domain-containing protein [Eubacterium sp.]|nr:DUF1385 domain-containing protein [Eubacterium sp.]